MGENGIRSGVAGSPLIAVSLACCCVLALVSGAAAESCHLREFDLCMTSAIVFIQQPQGTKVNEQEIEKQCNLFKETEQCLDDFTERCMSPMQNQLVEFMSGGMLKNMREYCRKGSDLRRLYLKHGDCVQKQRKLSNKCLIEFQAAIEKSTVDDTHWRDRPKVLCCALDRLQACNTKILEPACGKEALEVGDMLIRGTFSRAATVSCAKYKHTSAECQSLLPPPDTKPKGGRSSSVLSKLISTITQV